MESNVNSAAAANCVECGLVFPVDTLIQYRSVHVCATCKPAFMQKLSEGAQINTGEPRWAGFWIRVGATLVDAFILIPVSVGIQLLAGMSFYQTIGLDTRTPLMFVLAELLGLATGLAYEVTMIGRYGATLGKMACGIKVVMADGKVPIDRTRGPIPD